MSTSLRKAAKSYADDHTSYHELMCGNYNEERRHEEMREAFKAGYKFANKSLVNIPLGQGYTPIAPGSKRLPKAPRGGTGAI